MSLTLEGESDPFVAVLREKQAHPVSDVIFHCDLLQIPLGVPLNLEIGLNIEGMNKWVKGGDALLDVVRRTIEVECLPREVPDNIVIDITDLAINDRVLVGDLKLENATVLTDPDEVVLKINPNLLVAVEDEVAEVAEGAEGEAEAADKEAPETD
jgi:large subunit ribosomal protein L25